MSAFGYALAGTLGYLVGSSYKASLRKRNPARVGRMSKREALADFRENILPAVVAQHGRDDRPAVSEAWNNYTDALQKEGLISEDQYSTWTNPF